MASLPRYLDALPQKVTAASKPARMIFFTIKLLDFALIIIVIGKFLF
jgi:hypothetical protein